MAGPRADKVAVVEEVRDHLERASGAILTDYRGLKVGDLAALRRALRISGAEYKIYKNTLVRRATAESGHGAIFDLLVGPTAIAFVDNDVAAAAKVLRDFARTHPALIVKGSLIGTDLLDARSTTALADLPSRELLLAQIAGALAAPMQKFAGLVQALPRNLAYGLSALLDKRVAAGEVLPEPTLADEAPAAAEAPSPAAEAEAETGSASDDGAGGAAAPTPTDAVADETEAAEPPTAAAAEASADAAGSADEAAVSPASAADAGAEDSADAGAEDSADAGAEDSADAGAEDSADAGAEDSADAGAEDSADAGAEDSADAGAEDSADAGAEDSASPTETTDAE